MTAREQWTYRVLLVLFAAVVVALVALVWWLRYGGALR